MTCITINDLPSVETILPGELEQIFGAGPRTFRPSFEQLEDRQLLAASVTASFQNGVLDVEGTSGSDAIYLAQDNGNIQVKVLQQVPIPIITPLPSYPG